MRMELTSFIHSFIRSFIHSFVYSFIHSFICLFIHSFLFPEFPCVVQFKVKFYPLDPMMPDPSGR